MIKDVTNQRVVEALRTVLDPEVGINVIDLGLVYGIAVNERDVQVVMTMTSQACPLNSYFSQAAESAIRMHVPEVKAVNIEMIWEPQWNPAMMSESAKGLMGWTN
jgi:metal-sulfur cluster biosynthetic enzyme